MARVKMTAGLERDFSLRPGQKQSFLWDADCSWLAIRATAGAKVYIFQSRLENKSLRIKIGDVDAWGIDKAREEARRLQTLIDQGIDPRIAKADQLAENEAKKAEAEQKKTESQRQQITVGEAWGKYLEERRPRWSDNHFNDHVKLARLGGQPAGRGKKRISNPGPLASLMPIRLVDISSTRLKAWIDGETAERPTQAALSFRLFRAFLNWTTEHPDLGGLVDTATLLTRRVRENVAPAGVKNDVLQKEQLPAWFATVQQHHNPVIPAYLQALLLTGARREELLGLTWDAVDFRWQSLTIRDKVEGERIIPLTPYVAALLAALPRRNEWVFSSPTAKNGRLTDPSIFHRKAIAVAGLPPLTLHGLRRSFGSLAEWVELPAGVVAQIQGHKPSALAEKHYRVRPLDLLRQWHTKLEGWILEQAVIEQPDDEAAKGLRRVK